MSSSFNEAFGILNLSSVESQALAINNFVFARFLDLDRLINISEVLKTIIITSESDSNLELFTSLCFFALVTVHERNKMEKLDPWSECLTTLRPQSFYSHLLLLHLGFRVASNFEYLENLESELSIESAAARTPKTVLISLMHGDPFLAISQHEGTDSFCTIKNGVQSMHQVPMSILATIPLIRGTRSTRALLKWCKDRGATEPAKQHVLANMPTGLARYADRFWSFV